MSAEMPGPVTAQPENPSRRITAPRVAAAVLAITTGSLAIASHETGHHPTEQIESLAGSALDAQQATLNAYADTLRLGAETVRHERGRAKTIWNFAVWTQTVQRDAFFNAVELQQIARRRITSSAVHIGSSVSHRMGEAEFLACTRGHESDTAGGYKAVNPTGKYRGAYQFDQNTWDATAERAGRFDLVGVPPDQASPGDQDALATLLYHQRGTQPWGGRCG